MMLPITIGGVTYRSMSAAAEKLGIPYNTFYDRVNNGWPEAWILHGSPLISETYKKYFSMGMTKKQIYAYKRIGILNKLPEILKNRKTYIPHRVKHEVKIDGKIFRSVKAASKFFGVPYVPFVNWIRDGGSPEAYLELGPHEDLLLSAKKRADPIGRALKQLKNQRSSNGKST